MYCGTFLNLLGIMMLSLCTTYWQVFLAQGVSTGLGDGLLFPISVAIIQEYFSTRKSLATGLGTVGSSIGAVIYPVTFDRLATRIGFGWTVRVIGFINLATSIVYLLGIRQRPLQRKRRQLVDRASFRDAPFMIYCCGAFFGFMGVYVAYFYVQLYAAEKTHIPGNIATNLLVIINTSSTFGRVVPNFLADKIGAIDVVIAPTLIAGILALCWIRITSAAGLVIFCVLYGFFTGAFVSLHGPVIVSLSDDISRIGTRIGMLLGFAAVGVLIGNPVAGAIQRNDGSWVGLQIWTGVLMILSSTFFSATRILKFGLKSKAGK